MENGSEVTTGIQMERKQNPNHFPVKASKASGIFRAKSVCELEKRPGQNEVNGGDDVLGDVL